MQDRNARLDQQFIDAVANETFPQSDIQLTAADAGVSKAQLIDVFESQAMSRHLDLRSRLMQKDGNSFYTIGSAGHEGNAAVAMAMRPTDMAFLHYRSGAFVIQRSKQLPGQTPLYDMLLSFSASAEDPVSGGRHKVLGSKDLFIPPQTSTIASHLPKAVGAAFAVTLSRKVSAPHVMPQDGVVLCNFGDASANHSTAQGAFNAASWAAYQSVPLPIVFLCEDNGIGISTATPKGWIHANFAGRPGMEYIQCDGLNVLDTYQKTILAMHLARKHHKPVFLHMRTVRLLGHAGSDAEFVYRSEERIGEIEAQDPLLHTARLLREADALSSTEIIDLYQAVSARVERVSVEAAKRPRLANADEVKRSLVPTHRQASSALALTSEQRSELFAHDKHNLPKKQHMAKLLNWTLLDIMASYDNTVLFGEDVGRKGGVYNVTTKLLDKFGPRRVIDTLLDEQSILGMAIGLAHNGYIPIPEIQFLAYVHNAEDQIRGEAATLPFFSNGQFTNPMVIRIAGLAYQRGFGGHFHNDNSFAVFRDIPGVILACPSNGADAVEMMRTSVRLAQEQQRVVIFLEPIALYMKKDLHQEGDNLWSFDYVPPAQADPIELGELGVYGKGEDLCILTYGNGYYLSRQAEKTLSEKGVNIKIVDLRWLAPLNEEGILQEIKGYKQILIVDECRKTGSISEALTTLIVESHSAATSVPHIQRITAEDCFIPLGTACYEVLPKVEHIVECGLEMTGKNPALRSVG
ncbi:thiamine pyrophosphate-dependent enzyme [Alteromonas ponticola]|uniref:3-methyl-2-oxobutanoate dehydrogenase (2-methylpropanoyl-transferring) n=1 Tax=Alteromonas aquimaris TaxID=2998417 RepID=A0ABT3P693_9ALTE|nr:thiamine pyrophosphate-dependent enzyme [Alteromonas aquimaris]MCW8108282.1 thiamine pyrophosphate-dependent enzyme [Alteromonas aquimaris]